MSSLRSTKKLSQRGRRKLRVRKKIQGSAARPRLIVFRSAKHIYVQVIDDAAGATLASASTMQKPLSSESGDKAELAKKVGLAIADLCKQKEIEKVSFDRNGFRYHGRIRAVAEGAREGGLEF